MGMELVMEMNKEGGMEMEMQTQLKHTREQ